MTKRQLLVMTFLCVFAFGGVFGEFSNLEAKPRKKTTQTSKKKKSGKTSKSKNKTSGKKSSKNKTSKKKSSGKKTSKKTSKKNSKKSGKRYSKKKGGKKNRRTSKRYTTRVRTPRVYTPPTNGTYTPPKTYDNNSNNSGTEQKSDRQYKRENPDPVKKEPKKDGE